MVDLRVQEKDICDLNESSESFRLSSQILFEVNLNSAQEFERKFTFLFPDLLPWDAFSLIDNY